MTKLTIKEVKELLSNINTIEDLVNSHLNLDSRKGVKLAIESRYKQLLATNKKIENYKQMTLFENQLLQNNSNFKICGIDEVGRGPLAGPVVASAVILENNHKYYGLTDSKALSEKKRAFFEEEIVNKALAVAIGISTVEEIDKFNIYEATKLAMHRAIENLTVKPDYLLIDAMKLDINIPQTSIIKGDSKSVSIAAASVIAKEYRDRLMKQYAKNYPEYEFDKNKGYGTKGHLKAIETLGITSIHRKTFEPVKSIIKK